MIKQTFMACTLTTLTLLVQAQTVSIDSIISGKDAKQTLQTSLKYAAQKESEIIQLTKEKINDKRFTSILSFTSGIALLLAYPRMSKTTVNGRQVTYYGDGYKILVGLLGSLFILIGVGAAADIEKDHEKLEQSKIEIKAINQAIENLKQQQL